MEKVILRMESALPPFFTTMGRRWSAGACIPTVIGVSWKPHGDWL